MINPSAYLSGNAACLSIHVLANTTLLRVTTYATVWFDNTTAQINPAEGYWAVPLGCIRKTADPPDPCSLGFLIDQCGVGKAIRDKTGSIWQPDEYQIRGIGAAFARPIDPGNRSFESGERNTVFANQIQSKRTAHCDGTYGKQRNEEQSSTHLIFLCTEIATAYRRSAGMPTGFETPT